MKLIHAILGVGAASLLPTALAQTPSSPDARPFTVAFSSDIAPLDHADLRYPSYAGVRNLEGSCEVKFAVNTAGKADAIRVGQCSSDVFRGAAKKTVEAMRFAPRDSTIDNARMKIRWTMGDPAVRTASLD